MSWEDEVAELNRCRQFAEQMRDPEGIAKQRERGKLTARERIAGLADAGSFAETMSLVGSSEYEDLKLKNFVPKPQVNGTIRIDGRKVFVNASDFTVRGGGGVALAVSARKQQSGVEVTLLLLGVSHFKTARNQT